MKMIFDVDHVFAYHSPRGDQPARYEAIRAAGKHLAQVILELTSESADQSAALRHVREAVMTANAAIALDGRLTMPDPQSSPEAALAYFDLPKD